MQGLITQYRPYVKDGIKKVQVTVINKKGQASDMWLLEEEIKDKGLKEKALTSDELESLFQEYETIEYRPQSQMATLA